MSATSAVLQGRQAAEALMVDSCTIGHPAASEVYDSGSDSYTTVTTTFYAGACKVKPRDNADRQVEAGAETVTLWPFVVSVPMSVTGVQEDDVVTVTACELDPALVGTRLRVRQVAKGSFLTARRLGCEVQT